MAKYTNICFFFIQHCHLYEVRAHTVSLKISSKKFSELSELSFIPHDGANFRGWPVAIKALNKKFRISPKPSKSVTVGYEAALLKTQSKFQAEFWNWNLLKIQPFSVCHPGKMYSWGLGLRICSFYFNRNEDVSSLLTERIEKAENYFDFLHW